MILLAGSPGRVPSESPEGDYDRTRHDHFTGEPSILEISYILRRRCVHNLAFLVVCAHTQWIRPLHPARVALCGTVAVGNFVPVFTTWFFSPLRAVGVDAPPCLRNASARLQSTQSECLKLAFPSTSFSWTFASSLDFPYVVQKLLMTPCLVETQLFQSLVRMAAPSPVFQHVPS